MSLYIFDILFYHLTCLCNHFYGLSASVGYWFSAIIRRFIYKFLNVCPFDYTAFVVSGKIGIPLTDLTTPVGWLLLPQLTVLNHSVIEVFGGVFVLSRCFSDFSVGVGAFVMCLVGSLLFSL